MIADTRPRRSARRQIGRGQTEGLRKDRWPTGHLVSPAALRVALVAIVALFLVQSHPAAQFEKTLSATFDGWNQHADGSYDLVFGYMNRNSTEVEVPLGAANQVEPAPADHGQPTNFLPGRQRAAFRIPVPANFKGKYVWTVTYAGNTQVATASIDQNYSLDVGDPEPPGVKPGADQTIRLAEPASLSPVVTPPLPPAASSNPDVVVRRSTGARISVWWSKFRGPGTVSFGNAEHPEPASPGPTGRETPLGTFRIACAAPLTASCGATQARFSAPGTYWLRVVAAERSASNAIVKVIVNPEGQIDNGCVCSTNFGSGEQFLAQNRRNDWTEDWHQ